ncbi:MAG TPA: glycoside hydrolase family 99-like domain-containing protein [Oligoflexia bacterium]|nr:glycoside hydrolase family 99-like domain-containing protein [Oligoflexia bacterium]HMP48586.1 glycoside hydrolase family 99-like domain-containing protein [Oligoflexia bacterium]
MKTIIAALPAILLAISVLYLLKARKKKSELSDLGRISLNLFLYSLLALLTYSEIQTLNASSCLGHGLFTPGSLITRSITYPLSLHLRRLIEPSILFFIIFSGIYTAQFLVDWARKLAAISLSIIPAIMFFEGFYLENQLKFPLNSEPTWYIFPFLWILSFSGLIISFAIELFVKPSFTLFRDSIRHSSLANLKPALIVWAIAILAYGTGFSGILPFYSKNSNLIGAHYYLWFPENWQAGYAGKTDPGSYPTPLIGEYRSADIKTISTHLDEISKSGINLLLIDWWPRRPELKDRAVIVANETGKFPNLKFAAHVETLDINQSGSRDIIRVSKNEEKTFSLFIEHLAKRLFNHPQYLKTIDGRPVVFLYASRHLVGDIGSFLKSARIHTKKKLGFDPYFIGDEVFPNVAELNRKNGISLLPPMIPNWDRIMAFDAITLYNPYNPDRNYPAGNEGLKIFLQETFDLYENYRSVLEASGKIFIPALIPGYDDRVLRPKLDSTPIQRKDSSGVSTLGKIADISGRALGKSLPQIAIITSWNEWNEGTQIEPGIIIDRSTNNIIQSHNLEEEIASVKNKLWANQESE